MDLDSGHDGDDYLPGSRCFRKRRLSVRAMVDEEDPVWGNRPRRQILVKLYDVRHDMRLTVKIEPSPRPSSTSPPSASVISI